MSLVTVEDSGYVRHIVLNRPEKRNAFNLELIEALADALRATATVRDVHVVVLRGAGPVFSAGIDLTSVTVPAGEDAHGLRGFRRRWIEACALAEELTRPVVCAIHGACVGGALETALACDLRVSTADAVLGLPETKIGLIPDVGGSTRLPAVVGLGRAKELILTSRMIDGVEAERIGLVNRVAPPDELDAAVDALVGELLACSPVASGLAKRVMDGSARPTLAQSLEHEATVQELCLRSADFSEGAQAYAARRPAVFSGR